MRDLGIIQPGTTLYIPFHTFDSNDPSASVTLTGLATTDIEIYKDGSVTQRASDAGYALLDTDGIDFDTITGIHGLSIDLADNTTAGFYAAGSQYWVVISSITVDAATVNFVLCTFRIGQPAAILNTTIATLASQTSFTLTAGPAEDDALNGCLVRIHDVASAIQAGFAVVSDYTGSTKTVTLAAGTTFTAAATDNISFFPPALQPTVAGRTLDVSTGGEAGVDWANVGTPGSTVSLSATTVATVTTTGTATNVTTVNGLAAGVITAAAIATGAIDADALAADAGTEIGTAVWATATRTLTSLSGLTVDTVTTLANLPAITANWLTAAGIAADAGAELADAVWDEAIAGHLTAGSTGAALNAAGSAGDPWTTLLPGAYGAGTAGFIIGTNLDATVSSRGTSTLTQTQVTGGAYALDSASFSFSATTLAGFVFTNTGQTVGNIIDGSVVDLVLHGLVKHDTTYSAVDVGIGSPIAILSEYAWTTESARVLTAGTNIQLPANGLANVTAWTVNVTGSLSGSVGSVTGAVGSVTGAVGSVTGAVGSVTGNVGGNVVGSVGSVVGAVGSVTGSVGSVTGTVGGIAGTITTLDALDTAQDTQHSTTQTAIADVPTNAELATALGTADDATLAAIAALNNLSSAQAQTAAAAALTAYDPPTRAELTTDINSVLAQLPAAPLKNTAFTYVVKMVDATDGMTPETGLTITVTRSIDGAAFAAATGTVSEISTGHYKFIASAADMNGDFVVHRFAATGAQDLTMGFLTVS